MSEANHSDKTENVKITDFAEYSAVIREIMHTAWFISDTTTITELAHESFNGESGNPTPYYAAQLQQLIRRAAKKQMSLLERLEELTSTRPDLSGGVLDVLDLPGSDIRISKVYSAA